MSRTEIIQKILDNGVVAVIRIGDTTKLLRVIDAIAAGGVRCIEITMTVPDALTMIEQVSSAVPSDVTIGVGTVIDGSTAQSAIDAGAQFVVGPIFKKEIIDVAHRNDVPALPGCFSPTEIQTAHEIGADIIKVFPADVLGITFFKGILAPLPQLRLMPTGGVTLTNAGEWLRAGACAVGVGTALLDPKAIEREDYAQLTSNAQKLCESIAQGRNA